MGRWGQVSACVLCLILTACGSSNSTGNGVACAALSNGKYTYTPACLQSAYQITSDLGTGKGQTVALIEFYDSPNLGTDLTAFSQQFSLPTASLTTHYMGGQPTLNDATCNFSQPVDGLPNVCAGWVLEAALDAEMVHAIAPDANILVVFGGTTISDANILAAVDYAVAQGASVVSMSFSGTEFPGQSANDTHFNIPGVTFVAASGDNGSVVNWPAVSQYVLAVGGTTLKYNPTTKAQTETAWSGSGGGVSFYNTIPTYQSGIGGTASTTNRSVPDVAMVADSQTGVWVYDSLTYSGAQWITGPPTTGTVASLNWSIASGTSVGAPIWAGLIALANAKRSTPLGDVHSALYQAPSSSWTDITSGCVPFGLCAGTGYDLVTGLGTPVATKLLNYLIAH